jgi:DNA-binding NarL/FixJ family response regulator
MRIAIAEDLFMFREAIAKACEMEFGHRVVVEVDSGIQAIKSVRRAKPDVLILDLSLPDMDGFTVIDRLRASGCRTKFLVLSAYSDDYTVFRIEKANVHGFVDKRQNATAVLKEALQVVEAGGTYFSPTFEAARRARHADPKSFDKVLTESEQRILCVIGEGQTDDEIAQSFKISPRTAQTHRHNILWKLGIGSTPKLIAYAMRHGFTPRNPPLNSGRTATPARADGGRTSCPSLEVTR